MMQLELAKLEPGTSRIREEGGTFANATHLLILSEPSYSTLVV